MTEETKAEEYIAAEIDRAPEPMRRLGEFLADYLDEDQFKTADRLLLGAIEAANHLARALEFYANPEVYKPHPHGLAFDNRDLSFTARTALAQARKE